MFKSMNPIVYLSNDIRDFRGFKRFTRNINNTFPHKNKIIQFVCKLYANKKELQNSTSVTL